MAKDRWDEIKVNEHATCYNCGMELKIEKEICQECSDFGDGCGA